MYINFMEMAMKILDCDIAVIGASLGGLRAALSAANCGKRVILTEETDWVGGQMTSQGVPPDEHWHIEKQGGTKTYNEYRKKVRDHYRALPSFNPELKKKDIFDPGASWVSAVAHDPSVAHKIFCDELAPFISSGLITLMLNTVPVDAKDENDCVKSVTVKNTETEEETKITAKYFLDGTEFGDLLPLTNTEFRVGSDAKSETDEPSAPEVAIPDDLQPVTWVFALELCDELREEDRIKKPESYEFYKELKARYDDNNVLSWYCIGFDGKKRLLRMFSGEVNEKSLGLWEYRRIVAKQNYTEDITEASLINWPQQDYFFGSLFGNPDAEEHKRRAKDFSLCLAYWIQNDAPRIDGGFGYPVRLAGKYLGTEDGFAKAPYVRESRRIVAKRFILEQHVSKAVTSELLRYHDSVGIGFYSMDFHETIVTKCSINRHANPYEIPLGALVPIRVKNLLPVCKNIGTSHMTSSCYRLHPTEWNIGESGGYIAAFCIDKCVTPAEVYESAALTSELQELLVRHGIQLHWNFEGTDIWKG